MRVDELSPAPGANKAEQRVGRGIGGKGGKTAGRGTKGQQSRGRGKVARGFEGGQMPLKQRVPKLKGFNNPFRVEYTAVNLHSIAKLEVGAISPEILVAHGSRRLKISRSSHCCPRWHGHHRSNAVQGSPCGQRQPIHQPLIAHSGHLCGSSVSLFIVSSRSY